MRLSFHGAAREVTGSCHLLETKSAKLLIDCGMFQGERMCDARNRQPFDFDPKTIDAVIVTHPHADHTGRLPLLVERGFHGPIYLTEPTMALTRLVLDDAFHIMTDNAKRCGDEILYKKEDLESVFSLCKPIGYHQAMRIGENSVMLHDAGHVLGSAFVSIDGPRTPLDEGGRGEPYRVVFSGDIGNDDVPILNDTEPISHADIVVCESTYGHRVHEPAETRATMLKDVVEKTLNSGGALVVPAFSIERTQELLYELDKLLPSLHKEIPIFLDSPMSIKATELYRHYKSYLSFDSPILSEPDRDFFSFPGLKETLTTEESKRINDVPNPKVIIAGSGMMTGGRILHHLIRELPNPHSCLLIIGYQAKGTLGSMLFGGAKHVTIFGQKIEVKASVVAIGAFSAHGDQNKLTRWLQPTDGVLPKKIFLVHGDPESKEIFAAHLRETLKTEVIIPDLDASFDL